MKNFKLYIIFLLFISACAIQQPPTGGPPDKTPPIITESFPLNSSLNYSKDYVQFRFSKYMNKSSVIENLFISPNKQIDYDWSGKDLEISFKEPMDSNTTYSVTFGTEYTDLKGNKPEQSFSLIFSTGDKIDSGKIKGFVLNKKSDGIFIFAYNLNNINPDTLNPAHTRADYKTQIGSTGVFEIVALKPGNYRLFAVNDVYKDGLIDVGIDNFGCSLSDITVSILPVEDIKIKSGPPADKNGPILYLSEAISQNTIIAEFNESLDSSSINKNNFYISDSAQTNKMEISAAFLERGSSNKVRIITQKPLITDTKYLLLCRNDSSGVRDSIGNSIQDTSARSYFYGNSEVSENKKYIGSIVKDSSTNVNPLLPVEFVFNNSVYEINDINIKSYSAAKESKPLLSEISFPQENIIRVNYPDFLPSDAWINITLNLEGTEYDTIINLTYKTSDMRNVGSLSGRISDTSGYHGQYIISLYSKESSEKYTLITKDTSFAFESLPAGPYTIEISSDSNSNGNYDYGTAFPWQPAEKLMVIPKEVTIKPRWKYEDLIIIYNGR